MKSFRVLFHSLLLLPEPGDERELVDASDEAMIAETNRLLARPTRDIRLSGIILERYRLHHWRQRSQIVRAWMVWSICISLSMVPLTIYLVPATFWPVVFIDGLIVPAICAAVRFSWRKRRRLATENILTIVAVLALFLSYTIVGMIGGPVIEERCVTGGMFTICISLLILGLDMRETLCLATAAIAVFSGFMLSNETIPTWSALAVSFYYSAGIAVILSVRRAAIILSYKAFLSSQRDKHHSADLAKANARLNELATTDALTGLPNRRSIDERLLMMWRESGPGRQLAILMCDIDHFKAVNDSFGHIEGDRYLKAVAQSIGRSIRTNMDHAARFGGEEFLIVLCDVEEDTAIWIAERMRLDIEKLGLISPDSVMTKHVTVSIGIAMAVAGENATQMPQDVQKKADAALYTAKAEGRNRVHVYGDDGSWRDRSLPDIAVSLAV